MWLIDIVLNPGGKVPVRNRCKLLSFSSFPNHTHEDKQMKCQGHTASAYKTEFSTLWCACALNPSRHLHYVRHWKNIGCWPSSCANETQNVVVGVWVLYLIKSKNGFRHKMVGRKQNLLEGKQSLERIQGLPASREQQEGGLKSVTAKLFV